MADYSASKLGSQGESVSPAVGPAAIVSAADEWLGSAFLVSSHLLLTASFIVLDQRDDPDAKPVDNLRVRIIGSDITQDAEVIWWRYSKSTRAALLRIAKGGDRDNLEQANSFKFARLVGAGERHCETIGFTMSWDRDGDQEATRVTGTIDPATWPESHFLVFDARSLPSRSRGIGGAGVYCDGYLVGLIDMFNSTDGSCRVLPIAELLRDQTFSDTLRRELGSIPDVIDLLPEETTIGGALKDVSKADPSNIQEVAAAQFALSNLYYENVLAQAKRSFNAAVVASIAGLVFFLAAIAFAVSANRLTTSIISVIGGGIVEVVGGLNFWLYARTTIQLNSFHLRLERMQRFLLANSVTSGLGGNRRELALAELIRTISNAPSAVEPDGSSLNDQH